MEVFIIVAYLKVFIRKVAIADSKIEYSNKTHWSSMINVMEHRTTSNYSYIIH